jgi:hypothetical protein
MTDSEFTSARVTSYRDPITTVTTDTATIVTRMNIGGIGTIIGIITIEIMIATTTGIDASPIRFAITNFVG